MSRWTFGTIDLPIHSFNGVFFCEWMIFMIALHLYSFEILPTFEMWKSDFQVKVILIIVVISRRFLLYWLILLNDQIDCIWFLLLLFLLLVLCVRLQKSMKMTARCVLLTNAKWSRWDTHKLRTHCRHYLSPIDDQALKCDSIERRNKCARIILETARKKEQL